MVYDDDNLSFLCPQTLGYPPVSLGGKWASTDSSYRSEDAILKSVVDLQPWMSCGINGHPYVPQWCDSLIDVYCLYMVVLIYHGALVQQVTTTQGSVGLPWVVDQPVMIIALLPPFPTPEQLLLNMVWRGALRYLLRHLQTRHLTKRLIRYM